MELGQLLGVQAHDIVVSDERLGPVGRQKIAHQPTLPAEIRISASGAAKALSVWRQRERAAIYRIKAGRPFVEYQDGQSAEWRETLYDDLVLLEIPDPDPRP